VFNLFRTTLLGGIVFLIPVVLLLVVLGQAVTWIRVVSDPVVDRLPDTFVDHAIAAYLLAGVILLLLCLVAGLVSRTRTAARMMEIMEARVLAHVPLYLVLRSKIQAMLRTDEVQDLRSVMVRFDDLWQLAFQIERVEGGMVAVFLPGAPDPWSGSVAVVEAERVQELDLGVPSVAKLHYRLGRGSNQVLADYFRNRSVG
jgi:uncharacterized membrane protein